MVYRGKPSKGCSMCRTRRIKCDETRPYCNKCTSSGRTCPGFPSETDLLRNQPASAERKPAVSRAKASAALALLQSTYPSTREKFSLPASHYLPSPKSASSESSESSDKSPEDTESIVPAFILSIEDQAACHFVANFVMIPKGDGTRGFLDFIPPLIRRSRANPKSPLSLIFDACSFAFLGNRPDAYSSPNFEMTAIEKYQHALGSLRYALLDPVESKSDATLAAVLLMCLYETMTCKQPDTTSWDAHIEGAVRLTIARGRDRAIKSATGVSLFVFTRTLMIANRLISAAPPIMNASWWVDDAFRCEVTSVSHRHLIQTIELRVETTDFIATRLRTEKSISDIRKIIQKCHELDSKVLEWMRNTPFYFQFRTVAWVGVLPPGMAYKNAEVFPGRVDIYRDFWITSVWNLARCARLSLATTIIRCAAWICSPNNYRTTPEYASASRMCADVITEILASVPCNLGWHLSRPEIMNRINISEFACGEENTLKGVAGYFLTLPLASVVIHDCCTDSQRAWAKGRLTYICNELGIRQADSAQLLPWRVPSMFIQHDIYAARELQRSTTASQTQPPLKAPLSPSASPPPRTVSLATTKPGNFKMLSREKLLDVKAVNASSDYHGAAPSPVSDT